MSRGIILFQVSERQGQKSQDAKTSDPDSIPLNVLGLSVRAYNCLKRAEVHTVVEVASMADEEILEIRGVGPKTLTEIREKRRAYLDEHSLPERFRSSGSERSASASDDRSVVPGNVPIDVLNLSRRPYNALKRTGIDSIGELAGMSSREIQRIYGIGKKSLAEIEEKLSSYLTEHSLLEASHYSEPPTSQSTVSRQSNLLEVPIDVLGLSQRTFETLMKRSLTTVGWLLHSVRKRHLTAKDVGKRAFGEIKEKLTAYLSGDSTLQPESSGPTNPEAPASLADSLSLTHAAQVEYYSTWLEAKHEAGTDIETRDPIDVSALLSSESDRSIKSELVAHSVDSSASEPVTQALLDDISIERLGLLPWVCSWLSQCGIGSIGGLARQPPDTFGQYPLLEDRLRRYLNWLVEQDETTLADEVAGRSISPLHRLALAEISLKDLIREWLLSLDRRERRIIRWRYGLNSRALTLEEVGRRFEVTRERIRQLQRRALNTLSNSQSLVVIHPLTAMLMHLLEQAGGLMGAAKVADALESKMAIGDVDPVGVAHLVFEVINDVKWLNRAEAWGLESVPLDEVRGIQKRLTRVLEKEHVPLSAEEIIARLKSTRFYDNRRGKLEDDFILACLQAHPEISSDDESQYGLEKWERHRLDEMILALQEIGEPAHYTEIAERTNALLEPEMQTSAHNIHAHMQRLPDIFVRVGRGVYGLTKWDLYDDGSVANAAYRVLSGASKPLHHEVITDRVLETWCVQPTSVYAALQSDDRFVSIAPGVYWLRERIAKGNDAQEADFGDLFGERLQKWQEGLREGEDDLGYDTHAEADALRQMGTDFFE